MRTMRSRQSTSSVSRRTFGKTLLGISLPLILPSRLWGANAPSNRIRVGQIGCGRIARGHDMPSVLHSGMTDYVAVCDVDSNRAADGRKLVEDYHREKSLPAPSVAVYRDYREMLARADIDGIVISTPDHWHAEPALAAIYAGKDVYLQKPMTMTHAEGVLLRDAVVKSGRIFQLGSQQRSVVQFRRA